MHASKFIGDIEFWHVSCNLFPQASDDKEDVMSNADGDDPVGPAKDGNGKGDNWAPCGMIGWMVKNMTIART